MINPRGPVEGESRVLRGGSWSYDDAEGLRAAYRDDFYPGDDYADVSFRVAL